MDIKSGKPYPAGNLSNFQARPFTFRGVPCNSMEGLLQSFKFKSPDMQKYVCTLMGRFAKMKGKDKTWYKTQTLWWQGQPIKRDSEEYQDMLNEAYRSLYDQNEKARETLLATNDAVLTHSVGKSKANQTVLTEQEYCSRLMKLRREYQTRDLLQD